MNPRSHPCFHLDSVSPIDGVPVPAADELAALRTELAARADAAGLLDVAYRTLDTSLGCLLLAATPAGLVRIAFESQDHDRVLAGLAEAVSPRILSAPRRLDAAAGQLDEYLAGRRRRFDLPLDWSLATGFRRQVLDYLPTIAYGRTASYAEVAAGVDNPKAVRAVGSASASNPLPLVVPCHRVVRSDGRAGEYAGGADTKRLLLDLEAVA